MKLIFNFLILTLFPLTVKAKIYDLSVNYKNGKYIASFDSTLCDPYDCIMLIKSEHDSINVLISNTVVLRRNDTYDSFVTRTINLQPYLKNKIINLELIPNEIDQQENIQAINILIGNYKSILVNSLYYQFRKTNLTLFSAGFCILFTSFSFLLFLINRQYLFIYISLYSLISAIYLISFSKIPRFFGNPELLAGNIHFFLRILQDFILFNLFIKILSNKRNNIINIVNFLYLITLFSYIIMLFYNKSYYHNHLIIFYAAPLVATPMMTAFILALKVNDSFESKVLIPSTFILLIFQLNDLLVFWKIYPGFYMVKFYIPLIILMTFTIILKRFFDKYYNQQKKIVFINTARQVAHDIRSPLSAIKMSLSEIDRLNKSTRLILNKSISRIEDIANNLLEISRNKKSNDNYIHILSALNEIVAQKKVEKKDTGYIELLHKYSEDSYSCFAKIDPTKLTIILSNIINNSFESIEHNGKVLIETTIKNNKIMIAISDNGKGIEKQHIKNIGKEGFTVEKNQGNGLGLFNAIKTVNEAGGLFEISSKVHVGTKVTISLPSQSPPIWFSTSITVKNKVVILDDNKEMQKVWIKKLAYNNFPRENIILYSSAYKLNKEVRYYFDTTFLVDYEIINEEENGLDAISNIDSTCNTYLVTSYYEDKNIQDQVLKLNSKIIPKPFFDIVPLVNPSRNHEIVLIDDDDIIKRSWERKANQKKVKFSAFDTIHDFINEANNISKEAYIYIDSNLKNNIKGEVESKKIFQIGFRKIYISTGYPPESIQKPTWVIAIVSKSFPELTY